MNKHPHNMPKARKIKPAARLSPKNPNPADTMHVSVYIKPGVKVSSAMGRLEDKGLAVTEPLDLKPIVDSSNTPAAADEDKILDIFS
ncbi:MAG: hypothetical protein LBP22_14790 [Deltaproteobacteria bacterium]|jgi:hypothetical protein|nr:hypothetical protein [Deltaproteobacteria bacterium]